MNSISDIIANDPFNKLRSVSIDPEEASPLETFVVINMISTKQIVDVR